MDNRKNWTRQQDQLSKALASKSHFEEASVLFLAQHAATHYAQQGLFPDPDSHEP